MDKMAKSEEPEQVQKTDPIKTRIGDLERRCIQLEFNNIQLQKRNAELQEQLLVERTAKAYPDMIQHSNAQGPPLK